MGDDAASSGFIDFARGGERRNERHDHAVVFAILDHA
jgi:hypothetical protein